MSDKFRIIIIHILLIIGLIFVFTGILMPESPVEVKQVDIIDDEWSDTISPEEIIDDDSEYILNLPENNNIDKIDEYEMNDFSNETKEKLFSLINNEEEYILSTELPDGQFTVIDSENNYYTFEGELNHTNPIFVSLFGYILILFAGFIFMKLNKKKTQNDKNKTNLSNRIRKGNEDEEWKYMVKEDESNKN